MPEVFMARPTDVFISYLAAKHGASEKAVRAMLQAGRLAMALEIIALIRLFDEHESLAVHANEAVSILQTMLNEQGLAEKGHEWYELLNEWRKPKFADAAADSGQNGARTSGL